MLMELKLDKHAIRIALASDSDYTGIRFFYPIKNDTKPSYLERAPLLRGAAHKKTAPTDVGAV